MAIYDQFGRPVSEASVRKPPTRDIAVTSVRDRWSTYPSRGLTPVKLAQILREADGGDVARQAELFEEMEEKDIDLSSAFQTRKLAVQGLDWEITPADESASAKRVADFCVEQLNDLTDWDDYLLDMLDALAKGFSLLEINWQIAGSEARITGLEWIHPKMVTFWESLEPRLITEDNPQGVELPPFKFVYHRYKARSGYDTRAGIMRVCAWMYLFKNYGVKDWVAFAEVFGMPLRIGKYDQGASAADKDALVEAIRSLGSDAAGIISKATEIEFIEAQRSGSVNVYEKLVNLCSAQMTKAVLGQTLTSSAGERGSYALGKVHGDVRQDLLEADCRALSKTIKKQLLRPLVGFNFGWDVPVPGHKFNYEPPEDLKATAETYKVLVEMGYDVSQEHIEERFGVPKRKENETPLSRPQPMPGMGPVAAKHTLVAAKSGAGGDEKGDSDSRVEAPVENPAEAALEALETKALEASQDAQAAMLAPIEELLEKSNSLEEFRDGLLELYRDVPTAAMADLMQKAFTLADLSGRFDALDGNAAVPAAGEAGVDTGATEDKS